MRGSCSYLNVVVIIVLDCVGNMFECVIGGVKVDVIYIPTL